MKIEVFPRARDDITRQIRCYLFEQDAPLTAVRFREAERESIKQLEAHPRIGPVIRSAIPGLRSWPVACVLSGFYMASAMSDAF